MTNLKIKSNPEKGYEINVDLEHGVYRKVDTTSGEVKAVHALDYKIGKCNYFGTFYRVLPNTRLWVLEGTAYLVPLHCHIDGKNAPDKVRMYDFTWGRHIVKDVRSYKKAQPASLDEVKHLAEINAWADVYAQTKNVKG